MIDRAEGPSPYIRIAMIWAAILGCAMVNGFLREAILAPSVGTTPGYLVSGLILAACVVVVTIVSSEFLGLDDAATGFRVGVMWLAMTIAFEFVFGLTLRGQTMKELLVPYTFEGGNLWPMVLATILVTPWWIGRSVAIRSGMVRRTPHQPLMH